VISFFRRKRPDPAAGSDPALDSARVDRSSSSKEKDEPALLTIVGSDVEPGGRGPLPTDGERLKLLATSHVEAVPGRCVQCGICSYNCPVGIDVRSYSRRAMPVLESHCILCGECVARCPRGVLRFHDPAAGG
jgi:ferredoxin